MKILVLFFDMFKPSIMSNFSKIKKEDTKIDLFLKKFGGTSFINAYSHSCETYKSLACYQTGKIPKFNGVHERLGIVNDDEQITIKKLLNNHNYESLVIGDQINCEMGVYNSISDNIIKLTENTNNLSFIIEKVKEKLNEENIFIFLGMELIHEIRDDFWNPDVSKEVERNLHKFLYTFFSTINKDIFDFLIMFSDHGYKNIWKEDLNLIDYERSQIFLHLRKKSEKYLKNDKNLRSICDIFTTIKNILGDKSIIPNLKGKNLLESISHDYISIEDHKKWDMNKENFFYLTYPDIWGIKFKSQFYITDLEKENIILQEEEKKYYYSILEEETLYFKKFKMYKNKIKQYEKNKVLLSKYITSEKRLTKRKEQILYYLKLKEYKFLVNFFIKKLYKKGEKWLK